MRVSKRVQDTRLTEGEYRSLRDRLSYSSIKLFDENREQFYKELILGEKGRDKPTVAKTMGSLVHLYLAKQDFDEKFHLLSALEPKGQMKLLADNLYDRAMRTAVISNGTCRVTESFEALFLDAVAMTKYDSNMKEVAFKGKDASKILAMFHDSDGELYYKELLENSQKITVSPSLVERGEKLTDKIRGHAYTYHLANIHTGGHIEVFYELPILFEHEGVSYKSLPDKMIVDHEEKTIQPLDWKTSWDSEEPRKAYLKYGYYLQAPMYDIAIKAWALEHDLKGYTILPMKFVFCDTSGFADPVILNLTDEDLKRGYAGFTFNGWHYRGLKDLMSDIAWAVDRSVWTTSRELYENTGQVCLDIVYG